jgi:hypothetical protein
MPVTPEYPGVYIEELPSGAEAMAEVAGPITVFLGRAPRGRVNKPTLINSYADYERLFGRPNADSAMCRAVNDYFASGGKRALIVRMSNAAAKRAKDMDDRGELGVFLASNGLKKLN